MGSYRGEGEGKETSSEAGDLHVHKPTTRLKS